MWLWRFIFSAFTVLMVLLLFSAPYVTPGTASYYVSVLSSGLILVGLVASGVLAAVDWDPF
ncbi:hypothetical protein [Halomicrococcus sp. NG-SE-24]|uniref:hypothetical protein n=1 Tax=Halomicrococcus sp. NG-SE-24 TaxID=3436928 RepID=UPI003D980FCE